MSMNNPPQPRRLGSRSNAEHKSDIEIWANYLVVCVYHTDAKTMIAEQEPALWAAAKSMWDKDEPNGIAMLLTLDALLATPGAADAMVRGIRDALFIEVKDQCHEKLDPRVRALIKTLHE
jgi:hypothetical protein